MLQATRLPQHSRTSHHSNWRESILAFVGGSVDDRGSATIDALKNASGVISGLRYDPDDQNIYLDGQPSKRSRLAEHMEDAKRILIDATTLGLGEILNILMAIQIRRGSMVEFLYAEPGEYTKSNPADDEEPQHRKFALTTNCRFQAIHGYAHAYQANMLARHVFFLGYESARVRNAIEQRGDIDRARYQIQVVIGVPAFQAGWEANTIRTHLHVLEYVEVADHRIAYCQANSVRESYLTLWDLTVNWETSAVASTYRLSAPSRIRWQLRFFSWRLGGITGRHRFTMITQNGSVTGPLDIRRGIMSRCNFQVLILARTSGAYCKVSGSGGAWRSSRQRGLGATLHRTRYSASSIPWSSHIR